MPGSVEGIRIQLEGIGHLVQDSRLAVPPYQRSYAWTEKNITQLFRDLSTALVEQEQEYFLGSIVLIDSTGDRPSVVDGQQRLATITMLIAAIRDYFDEKGDQRAQDVERGYLLNIDLRTQEPAAKLRLNDTDNDFFFKRILTKPTDPKRKEKPTKESHDRIVEGAHLAVMQVKRIADSTNDPSSRLIDWIEYISTKARVIRIQVPDSANAFRIFETLNDRGLRLALSDLLKNYLFQQSGDRIGEAQKNWVAMASVVEAAEDEGLIVDFIRHLWCSQNGVTREKELYDRIKEKITSKQKAIDFSNTLADSARTYAAIVNTDNELWTSYGSEARSYMATLNLLGMTQIRPLILSILEEFGPAEVKRSLRLFVSWAVRFVIVGGVGGGTLESHYSTRASEVTGGTIKTAAALLKEMRATVPSDSDFENAFSSATVSRHPHARYYLRVLERQQAGEEEPEFVPNTSEEQITLEHVLPQNPDKDWKHFDQETANRFYKRMGNLALMKKTKNEAAGNAKFPEKLKLYSKSEFKLTVGLKAYAEKRRWTTGAIEARQKMLAQLAVQAWPNKVL